MSRQKSPDWPHQLAEAIGNLAMAFAQAEFAFAHLVGYAENLDRSAMHREVLGLPPSEKIARLRRAAATSVDTHRLYRAICDRFEELLENRNRYIHAYWYRVEGEPEEFVFVDIHGRKGRLSKETHICTLDDVVRVGMQCGVHVHNLQVLRGNGETAGFFEYFVAPEAIDVGNPAPRKVGPPARIKGPSVR